MNFHENTKSGVVLDRLLWEPAVLAIDFSRKRVTFRNSLWKSYPKSDTFGRSEILGEWKPTVDAHAGIDANHGDRQGRQKQVTASVFIYFFLTSAFFKSQFGVLRESKSLYKKHHFWSF